MLRKLSWVVDFQVTGTGTFDRALDLFIKNPLIAVGPNPPHQKDQKKH